MINILNGQKVQVKVGGDFPVIPMDKYTCQITDVNLKQKVFDGVETDGLNYELTVLDNKTMPDGDKEPVSLRGRKLWYWVSLNLSPRSNLGKLVSAVRGRDLTKIEMQEIEDKGFQAEDLINEQIDVVVELVDGKGKNAGRQFNNVTAVAKTGKELPAFDNEKVATGEEKSSTPVSEVAADKSAEAASTAEVKGDGFIAELEADK